MGNGGKRSRSEGPSEARRPNYWTSPCDTGPHDPKAQTHWISGNPSWTKTIRSSRCALLRQGHNPFATPPPCSSPYEDLHSIKQHRAHSISSPPIPCTPPSLLQYYCTEGRMHSEHFPPGYRLQLSFAEKYQLQDELGSGGYGFVMTAYHRVYRYEVAVKFIIKEKVPDHAWMEDEGGYRLPTEVVILSYVNHENIVKCLDLYEDPLYFYVVQELHGSPWDKNTSFSAPSSHGAFPSPSLSTPSLSPSSSSTSLPNSGPNTPPHTHITVQPSLINCKGSGCTSDVGGDDSDISNLFQTQLVVSPPHIRPEVTRRASHDLFECIEQSEQKRLTEEQARYVFSQVVDAVHYLDSLGIAHRDIKDENLVVDKNFKVKLIDFGSATAANPEEPRPSYELFYGTAAYASSEILQKKRFKAAPAEIWTLGVLLSYLLTGISPFPTTRDAVEGRIFHSERVVGHVPEGAMDLMRRCLHPDPDCRATILEVRTHPWLRADAAHP